MKMKRKIKPLLFFTPGPLVKKITFKKPLDFFIHIVYTYNCQGDREKRYLMKLFVIGNPLNKKNIKKHKKGIDTNK